MWVILASTVGTNAYHNEWALVSVHTIVLLHGCIGTLHYAKQEDGGYREGFLHVEEIFGALCGVEREEGGPCKCFLHVEEILGGSFGVCEVSDCIQALYSSFLLM